MQKDVIYIDTEDDITAIIGKVKDSSGKVVALVPPKRIGAIQSAVNLKLVHRAAESDKKHLVIVTNNHALSALAGSAGIPIAKNLESRPEMPEISALEVDDNDIIDGNELPVGEHAGVAARSEEEPEDKGAAAAGTMGTAAIVAASSKLESGKKAVAATAAKARTKVPNFDSFRKKMFIGIAGVILLVGFLVWAIAFAPRATITIKAKTSETALNSKASAGASLTTSLKDGTIKAEIKTTTKDVSIPFTATGKKDVGEKATGSVSLAPTLDTIAKVYYGDSVTIPAGSQVVSSSGLVYLTDTAAVFSDSSRGAKTVGVTAAENGTKYNAASGPASKSPIGTTANFTAATSGGTDKTITVVQQSDIDTVSGDIIKSSESEAAKKSLIAQFGKDYIVIADTFKADAGAVRPSPAAGQEATDGKGTLSGQIAYSVMAVPKAEAGKYLDAYFAQQIDGKTNQKVYDNGIDGLTLTNPVANGESSVVTVVTNGKIGPKIDENEVKEFAKGKKAGEIKVYAESVSGVEFAEVEFSPFWVTQAPGDTSKIKVEFKIDG